MKYTSDKVLVGNNKATKFTFENGTTVTMINLPEFDDCKSDLKEGIILDPNEMKNHKSNIGILLDKDVEDRDKQE